MSPGYSLQSTSSQGLLLHAIECRHHAVPVVLDGCGSDMVNRGTALRRIAGLDGAKLTRATVEGLLGITASARLGGFVSVSLLLYISLVV